MALANPQTAPYGRAAQEVLSQLGASNLKLLRGESVAQALQFVSTGNVAAGFVAYAQLLNLGVDAESYWLPPEHWYQPIEQQAQLLTRGYKSEGAQALLTFLQSEPARTLIAQAGYGLAEVKSEALNSH